MKVSLNTVRQFTKVDVPVDELVHRINQQLGGVESVVDLSARYKDAVIVKVLSAVKHENADKLSVCIIDDGGAVKDVERNSDGHVQVVCGAPNVHGDMLAIWLPPGSTVPASVDDAEPFVLAAREIRGVKSNGMLAAADELAIGSDHDGIVEINPDEWRPNDMTLKPGVSFAAAYGLDDTIIDIENKMFTHRPDLFGQIGVAREISAILKGIPPKDEAVDLARFPNPDWYWSKPKFEQVEGLPLEVYNDIPDKTPRFIAVAMQGITVGPSPLWLQCALVTMGGKPINNVVDLTNYIMLLTAQPTHAYDYDKLSSHRLGARMAIAGEKIMLLNGKEYELSTDDIVIADGEKAIGLAGIMGGGNSEVSADTKNIVLEVANFDMYTVRKSSMRYGLFTDALTRFNKGQSPLQNDRVLAKLMELMSTYAGAKQASAVYDLPDGSTKPDDTTLSGEIPVSVEFINTRLGLQLEAWQIGGLLRRTNFASYPEESNPNNLLFTAPFWRTDIVDPEDIVEEIGRLYGYDKLPRELPMRSIKPAAQNHMLLTKQAVRRTLSGAGANEVLTYSFVHERTLVAAGQDPAEAYQLGNALSPDLQYYRLSLTPSLLAAVHPNIKAGHDRFALYEFGKAHRKGDLDEDGLPAELGRLGFVYAARKQTGSAYYTARRYVSLLGPQFQFVPLSASSYQENSAFVQLTKPFEAARAALVFDGDRLVGVVGEYTAATRRAFKLPAETAGFELFQSALEKRQATSYVPLSRFPKLTQDISLKVQTAIMFGDVQATADAALDQFRSDLLRLTLAPLGVYQPADGGTKTITLRLTAVHYERTLTDAEVTTYLDAIATAAAENHSAEKV